MIRAARENELEHLTSLARRSKASWGYSDEFMRGCREELTVTKEHLPHTFVVEVDSRVVGFYAISRSNHQAELEFLFVEPSELRRGHGRALLEHAKGQARRLGCRMLVIQGDPNAAAFYAAAHAIKVGERESDSIAGRMLPLYELPLD